MNTAFSFTFFTSFALILFSFVPLYGQFTVENYEQVQQITFTSADSLQPYTTQLLMSSPPPDSNSYSVYGVFYKKNHFLAYLFLLKIEGTTTRIAVPLQGFDSVTWQVYEKRLQRLSPSVLQQFTIVLSNFLSQKSMQVAVLLQTDSTAWAMQEEETSGVVIPKKTNPLMPDYIEGIVHHTVRFAPEHPRTARTERGRVVLDFCVNTSGEVIFIAINYEKSSIQTPDILDLAKANLHKYKFSMNVQAPERDCGTITYLFLGE